MPSPGFWSRVRHARLFGVVVIYLGASWLILQVVALLQNQFLLPKWVTPLGSVLLLIGFVIIVATAWVQSRATGAVAAPSPWELNLKDFAASVAQRRLPHLTWARALMGGLVGFSLLFGVAGAYVLVKARGGGMSVVKEATAAAGPGIAVLPFRVVGPGMDLWREGMVDLLSTNLEGVAGVRKIDPRAVLSKWRREIGDGAEPADQQTALKVAGAVGATYAVMGSVVGSESGVRLTAEVYDLPAGTPRGSPVVVEGFADSVLVLANRLSVELLRQGLVPAAGGLGQLDVSRVTTSSLSALREYLEGEQKYRRSRFTEALAHFRRAVEHDSTFALAWYRVALAHVWTEGGSDETFEYADRAARLADRLPERDALLLRGYAQFLRGRLTALRTFEQLTARYPDDLEGWAQLGEAQLYLGPQVFYRRDEFRSALRRALELNPFFGPPYIHFLFDAFAREDSAGARELLVGYRQIDSESPSCKGWDLAYALVWGDSLTRSRRLAELDTFDTQALACAAFGLSASPDYWDPFLHVSEARLKERHPLARRQNARAWLASGYLRRGRIAEAREMLSGLATEERFRRFVPRVGLLLHLQGYADTATARRAARDLAWEPESFDQFLIGALAVQEKRWPDVEAQVRALESGAAQAEQKGDTLEVSDHRAYAQALRGYTALRRGGNQVALRGLGEVFPNLPGFGPFGIRGEIHDFLRYEAGRLLVEREDWREAERYFQSFGNYSQASLVAPVEFYLGQVYEGLRDPERARAHYARFVKWWDGCDADLRPWWETGRQALDRLTREASGRTASR